MILPSSFNQIVPYSLVQLHQPTCISLGYDLSYLNFSGTSATFKCSPLNLMQLFKLPHRIFAFANFLEIEYRLLGKSYNRNPWVFGEAVYPLSGPLFLLLMITLLL